MLDNKEKKGKEYKSSGYWSIITDSIKIIVIDGLKNILNDLLEFVSQRLEYMQKQMTKLLAFYVFLLLGAIFMSIAIVNLIEQYLAVSKGWSNFIIAVILILIAFIIKANGDKK